MNCFDQSVAGDFVGTRGYCSARPPKLEQELVVLIDEKQGAGHGGRVVKLVGDMRTQWKEIDRRIGEFDAEFAAYAKADEVAALLFSIPGVGESTQECRGRRSRQ